MPAFFKTLVFMCACGKMEALKKYCKHRVRPVFAHKHTLCHPFIHGIAWIACMYWTLPPRTISPDAVFKKSKATLQGGGEVFYAHGAMAFKQGFTAIMPWKVRKLVLFSGFRVYLNWTRYLI